MPYRALERPGTPDQHLSGKPIRYYRPQGSAGDPPPRRRRISGLQRRRLAEACRDLRRTRCSAPEHDTTIGLTIAGAMTPAGLGGCVIEMMDRGLVDFIISHRREPLSRPALRAELHAPPRLAVRRRRRAVRGRRHPHLRRAVSGDGAASRPTPTSATSSSGRG